MNLLGFDKHLLQQAETRLLRITEKFQKAKSFLEVYYLVREVTEDIKGLARMFYYDTSLRIAISIGEECLPEHVFYQRGAEIGAKKLGILTDAEVDEAKPYLPYNKFTRAIPAFKRLKPYQIEDFLCIYHKELKF